MSIAARDAALKRITEDSNCKILLMSLKAGGVALNLTVASHVRIYFPVMARIYLLNKHIFGGSSLDPC